LEKYKGKIGEKTEKALKSILCWGCGQDGHSWRDRQTKLIVCPNKDKPGVAERASLKHKTYLENLKSKKNEMVQRKKIKFTDLNQSEREVARSHFLREASALSNSATSSITNSTASATPPATPSASGISFPAVVLINNNRPAAPILPVPIDNQLPHIIITLGELSDSLETCPTFRGLYDSGASCSTGSFDFWLPILKGHPSCIEEIHTSEKGEYHPIVLGGIVSGEKGREFTADLTMTVNVKLKLRYTTKSGQPVSHIIALGKHVTVNTILGNSFIKSLHCVYDAAIGIVEAKMLDAPPFKVVNCIPQRYSTADKIETNASPTYASIIKTLEEIEKAVSDDKPAPTVKPWTYTSKPMGPITSPNALMQKIRDFNRNCGTVSLSSGGSDDDSAGSGPGCAIWGKAGNLKSPTVGNANKRIRFDDGHSTATFLRDDWDIFE
jgi:hypothetical protein